MGLSTKLGAQAKLSTKLGAQTGLSTELGVQRGLLLGRGAAQRARAFGHGGLGNCWQGTRGWGVGKMCAGGVRGEGTRGRGHLGMGALGIGRDEELGGCARGTGLLFDLREATNRRNFVTSSPPSSVGRAQGS